MTTAERPVPAALVQAAIRLGFPAAGDRPWHFAGAHAWPKSREFAKLQFLCGCESRPCMEDPRNAPFEIRRPREVAMQPDVDSIYWIGQCPRCQVLIWAVRIVLE